MVERTVLTTDAVRDVVGMLVKNDDELVIRFSSKISRDAFVRWLRGLQKDAAKSPAERYEVVRRQMGSSDPSTSE